MLYVLQNGLNIGVPYPIVGYLTPANGVLNRNIAGEVASRHRDDLCRYFNDQRERYQGADPNKLVKVMDKVNSTTLPVGDGDYDRDDKLGIFTTIGSVGFGEVLRDVTLAPVEADTATVGLTAMITTTITIGVGYPRDPW